VGRIIGQFLSNDPLAYRREKKNEKNQSLFGSNYKNKNFWSKVIADSSNDIISHGSKISHSSKNSIDSNYLDLFSQPTRKADYNKDSSSDPFREFVQRKLRLQEFNFLLIKYYSQQTASKILALATYLVGQGNDDFFEKMLTFLRELYSGNSFDNSVADRPNLEKSYPHVFDFSFLLPKPDKKRR
jgi:hypothetical protein